MSKVSIKLFLCRLGFHKWIFWDDDLPLNHKGYWKFRRCSKCEKVQKHWHGWYDFFSDVTWKTVGANHGTKTSD